MVTMKNGLEPRMDTNTHELRIWHEALSEIFGRRPFACWLNRGSVQVFSVFDE